jgi:hypothetical protein
MPGEKRPGLKNAYGWYGAGVRDFDATESLIASWQAMGASVGLRFDRDHIAVDIDTLSPEWAEKIETIALEVLGPSPCRIGRDPKRLLVYGVAEGEKFFYRQIRFDDGQDAGKAGLVEFLAGPDKWAVVEGIHPGTGRPYRWTRRLVPSTELAVVDAKAIATLYDRLNELLPAFRGKGGSPPVDREKVDQEKLKGDAELVRSAVAAIPNKYEEWNYDEWVKLAVALRAACAEDFDAGLEIFQEFTDRTDLLEPDERETAERVYRSVREPFAIGADWIYRRARKHGWYDDRAFPPAGPAPEVLPVTIQASPYRFPDPATMPRREWLYGTHYIRRFVSATVAPSGVGKSSLGIVEALAMAAGKPLLGVQPKGKFRVWIWNGEDPLEELERRIAAGMLLHGLTPEDIGDRLFVNSGRDMPVVLAHQGRDGAVIHRPVQQAIVGTLQREAIDVSIIDPFVSSHQVSENDNGAIDLVTKEWARIADMTNTSVELVHHVRKLNGGEITVEDMRGAVALLATSRSARALARMTKSEGTKLGLEAMARRLFRFADAKNNLALPADAETLWFELASVNLDNGPGEGLARAFDGDSVGAVRAFTLPTASPVTADEQEQVLRLVKAGEWRRDQRSGDAWIGVPVAQGLGLDIEADKARIRSIISEWIKAGTLREVSKPDDRRRPKTFVEASVPPASPDNLSGSAFE